MLIITQLWHIRQATRKNRVSVKILHGEAWHPQGVPLRPLGGTLGHASVVAVACPCQAPCKHRSRTRKNKRSAINGRQTELRISASAQHEKSTSILSRPTGTRRVVERRRGNSSF